MTAMKNFLYGFLGLLIFVLIAIVFFVSGANSFENSQDEYFSKVDYSIRGKMISYKLLGGSSYLIEIRVDTISILKNKIKKQDKFVGLYDPLGKKIFLLSYYEEGVDDSYEKITNDSLPYVNIISRKREIEFKSSIVSKASLRTHSVYKEDLLKFETKEMIRF